VKLPSSKSVITGFAALTLKTNRRTADLSEKDLSDLRERVVRLEVQVSEMNKRLESLSNYAKQLYEYLNKLGR
jgi:uncharacterized protein YceH (UPF0502 family)